MPRLHLPGSLLLLSLNMFALPSSWAVEPIFHTRSYNAFTRVYGRPDFFSGSMHSRGVSEARVTLNLVSFSEIERSGADYVELDGETYEAAFDYDYNLSDRWEVGLRIPYLYNSGGFMDSSIDGFHDLFGMPEGDRPQQNQDKLLFLLQTSGQNQFLLDDSGGDIGDIQLRSRILLTQPADHGRALALYGGIKLPSGDEDKLTGSGATDYSIGLGYTDPLLLAGIRTVISAHAGILILGDGNVLEDSQKNTVGFGGLQLAISATERLTLLAQIQAASAYYDNDLDILGGNTVQLSFGANISWPESGWDWRFGIVEDGLSKVMPDFALHMEVSRKFGGR